MIIQTGQRTDIPAYYSEWFANRLQEGYVLVRNPYNPISVTRYELTPDVVDLIGFCSKNPEPLLKHMDLLRPYHQYWFVTITPYDKDMEPNVPPKETVMETFRRLSSIVGPDCIAWRYDPIIINETWTSEKHFETFREMASTLAGYTKVCVISFIMLYEKVKINFPEVKLIPEKEQIRISEELVKIAKDFGMTIRPCGDSRHLTNTGADCSGCMTQKTFETAIGQNLNLPSNPNNRKECACYITGDIGAYNTCGHLCRYCYANSDPQLVAQNMRRHDPHSPLITGNLLETDNVHQAKQKSWIDPQLRLF
ncbi:MAG: DUF1848 domain-containing protein [Lachnospiraceae bacterium]|nr:DUF1848 domain-containing protein [Lachnospiraceae bacterium]